MYSQKSVCPVSGRFCGGLRQQCFQFLWPRTLPKGLIFSIFLPSHTAAKLPFLDEESCSRSLEHKQITCFSSSGDSTLLCICVGCLKQETFYPSTNSSQPLPEIGKRAVFVFSPKKQTASVLSHLRWTAQLFLGKFLALYLEKESFGLI